MLMAPSCAGPCVKCVPGSVLSCALPFQTDRVGWCSQDNFLYTLRPGRVTPTTSPDFRPASVQPQILTFVPPPTPHHPLQAPTIPLGPKHLFQVPTMPLDPQHLLQVPTIPLGLQHPPRAPTVPSRPPASPPGAQNPLGSRHLPGPHLWPRGPSVRTGRVLIEAAVAGGTELGQGLDDSGTGPSADRGRRSPVSLGKCEDGETLFDNFRRRTDRSPQRSCGSLPRLRRMRAAGC